MNFKLKRWFVPYLEKIFQTAVLRAEQRPVKPGVRQDIIL
jgi:hypothetical protein